MKKKEIKHRKKKIKLNVFSDLKICGFLATKFTHVNFIISAVIKGFPHPVILF